MKLHPFWKGKKKGKKLLPDSIVKPYINTVQERKESAAYVRGQLEMAQQANKKRSSDLLDAILEMREAMDRNNVPERERAIRLSHMDYNLLRSALSGYAAQANLGSVSSNGVMGSIHGLPVHVEPAAPLRPVPLAQEEMDELASVLTETVLLLRAGDERGAMTKLASVDGMCDVDVVTRSYPEEKTATEIQQRANSALYGKRIHDMLKDMHESMRQAQVQAVEMAAKHMSSSIDDYIMDTMTYGHSQKVWGQQLMNEARSSAVANILADKGL